MSSRIRCPITAGNSALTVVGHGEISSSQERACLGRPIEGHARSWAAAQAQFGALASRPHEIHDVVLDRGSHLDRPYRFTHREERLRWRDHADSVKWLGALSVAPGDPAFVDPTGIAEPDPDEKAVQLRLRQRKGPLQLDGVLGGEHEEWVRQVPRLALDRHVAFLHGLQQRRL